MNRLIIIFLLSIILGCNSQKNELEFEKKVFNEIFLELIDSTFYDFRTLQPPLTLAPLPNGITISESQKKENLKTHKKYLADFKKRKIEIEKDTSRIVIAIVDTIFTLGQDSFEKLGKNFENLKFKNDSLEKKIEYKINLSKFKNNEKFIFKYYSEFPKGRKIWRTEYPFHLGAVISFSRIYFDRNKKNGVIESGTTFGILNGNGFRIFIKKVSDKWRIEKIEGTWIS
ncbi:MULTISPECIES: hypothetical protein [unclassified Polaribacter]|uniref:hypothetical protein n=1 Tax=unclassified Polaribacter TaxID=196858 RepID=UPI00140B9B91|nr:MULTISPECIES: hypothetical protein [unclassified Polaribacter]QVY66894.1 hypothetical protein JOP69_06320 [Polaribacter sp. Q13]